MILRRSSSPQARTPRDNFLQYNTSHQVRAFLALQSLLCSPSTPTLSGVRICPEPGPVWTCTPTRHSPCGMALVWQRLNGVWYGRATIFFVRTVGTCAPPYGAGLNPPPRTPHRGPSQRDTSDRMWHLLKPCPWAPQKYCSPGLPSLSHRVELDSFFLSFFRVELASLSFFL